MSTDISPYLEELNQAEVRLKFIETELQHNPYGSNNYLELNKEYSSLDTKINILKEIIKILKQYLDNIVLEKNSNDFELIGLLKSEQEEIITKLKELKFNLVELTRIDQPEDNGNAIIEIRAGTGGEEAALFAQELFRAYSKFAVNKNFKVEIANISYSNGSGFKEIIFFIEGKGAYKLFKYESGVHRVQRVPATESAGRIHTSTISIVVLPEMEEKTVVIKPEDLRIDVYRSTGPGGQSVNTTDSAVRIVHLPTNIVVTCQDQKSQLKNKAKALKILQAKLYDRQKLEDQQKLGEIRQAAIQTGDRSAKIRTYNFPQSRVTDHRYKLSWHNLGEIMEGNFTEIIEEIGNHLLKDES